MNHRRQTIVAKGLLAIAVGTPILALGAVHTTVLAIYLLVAAGGVLFLFFSKHYPVPRLDLFGALLLALAAYTLVQIIPLPSGGVAVIAPAVHAVRARALAPLGEPAATWMPLSLDVTLTVGELGKLLLYLSVYWLAVTLSRKTGPRFVVNLVTAVGVATASILLAHRIFLMDAVYGVYKPLHVGVRAGVINAPLINPNHLAGALGLCTAVAFGRALAVRDRARRGVALGIAALIGGALMITLSRGGIAAFVAGQGLFFLLRFVGRYRRRHSDKTAAQLVWLPLGLVFSLGLGFLAAQDAIVGEFLGGDIKKLDVFLEGVPLIGRFWTTGVGRGAFRVGFPLVSDLTVHRTFTHAENTIIQILSDWGVPVGGAALIAAGTIMVRHLRHAPKRIELVACVAALAAFGLHNLVDFNMEIPGVAVMAVAILGAIAGARSVTAAGRRRSIPRSAVVLAAVASIVTAAVLAGVFAPHSIDRDERAYRDAWETRDDAPFERQALKRVLRRHPADWYIPFITGVRQFHLGDGNPLPWLARAVELNPSSAVTHFYIGRALLRAGHLGQGMMEFRLAARFNVRLALPAAKLLVARVPRFSELKPWAVTRQDETVLWPALGSAFVLAGASEESEAADLAVLRYHPRHPQALARQIRRLMSRGEHARAMAMAHTLSKVADRGPISAELKSEIYLAMGEPEKAVVALEQAVSVHARNPALLRALAWARQRAGDHAGAMRAAGQLKGLATNMAARARGAVLEARICLSDGRPQQALARYREAHLSDPANLSILKSLADLAVSHGDTRRALEALRELKRRLPGDARIQAQLKRIASQAPPNGAELGDNDGKN